MRDWRRSASCKQVSPEQREFEFDPLADIQQDRGKYIKAALTIPLAYIAAGGPRQKTPLASFTGWSRIVRDPLLWLGCADPVSSQVKLRITDPVRENRGQVFKVWRNEFIPISLAPCLKSPKPPMPGIPMAGRDLHPLEKRRLVAAHVVSGPSPEISRSTRAVPAQGELCANC